MHHCHVPQVSPRALHVLVLSEATQQGDLQGAERQALLPRLLREALQLSREHTAVQLNCQRSQLTLLLNCLSTRAEQPCRVHLVASVLQPVVVCGESATSAANWLHFMHGLILTACSSFLLIFLSRDNLCSSALYWDTRDRLLSTTRLCQGFDFNAKEIIFIFRGRFQYFGNNFILNKFRIFASLTVWLPTVKYLSDCVYSLQQQITALYDCHLSTAASQILSLFIFNDNNKIYFKIFIDPKLGILAHIFLFLFCLLVETFIDVYLPKEILSMLFMSAVKYHHIEFLCILIQPTCIALTCATTQHCPVVDYFYT